MRSQEKNEEEKGLIKKMYKDFLIKFVFLYRYRSMKEKMALTEIRKYKNRMSFGPDVLKFILKFIEKT